MKKLVFANNEFMIRLPFQDEQFKRNALDIQNNLDVLMGNSIFCEQLLIASQSLFELFEKNKFEELSSKKQRNFVTSMTSYINRSATRTTPFGLFSSLWIN